MTMTVFLTGWKNKKKKKTRYILFAYLGVDFSCKTMQIGMHDAIAQIGLETNSSADISLEMEKGPLLQWICWLK